MALKAETLLLLSNVPGLLRDFPNEATLIETIPAADVESFIGFAEGRMKKKVLVLPRPWRVASGGSCSGTLESLRRSSRLLPDAARSYYSCVTMKSLRWRFAVFGFAFFLSVPLLTACPYPDPYISPPPPPDYDFKGTWLGTLNDSQGGEGALTLVFTYQSASTYEYGGSWQADFGTSGTEGVFEGQANYGTSVSALLFLSKFPNCALEIKGSRDEDTVSGTYRASSFQPEGCGAAAFSLGTFTVTKQTPVE